MRANAVPLFNPNPNMRSKKPKSASSASYWWVVRQRDGVTEHLRTANRDSLQHARLVVLRHTARRDGWSYSVIPAP